MARPRRDFDAILAPLRPLARDEHYTALSAVFADVDRAPARFLKKLKALTSGWSSEQILCVTPIVELAA